jgi:DNA-binding SARP family transcriptional activator
VTVRSTAQPRLCLLGQFDLVLCDETVSVPLRCQQVLALLALRDRPVERRSLCAALWPDEPPERCRNNLRTTIWRLRQLDGGLVLVDGTHLRLSPAVDLDVSRAMAQARDAIDAGRLSPDLDLRLLSFDLLEDWDDEWVILERERFRQLRMHALETISVQLSRQGAHSLAVEAGLGAISAEPFRESAHRALIEAFIGEGNLVEAIRQYQRFSDLAAELGIMPSPRLTALMGELLPIPHDAIPAQVRRHMHRSDG